MKNFLHTFLDNIKNPSGDKLKFLERKLVELYFFCIKIEDSHSFGSNESGNYDHLRKEISTIYPELGYYNEVTDIQDPIGKSEFIVGDSIDDLVDLLIDIQVSMLHEDDKRVNSNFKFLFETHSKSHLIALLRYLSRKNEQC